jgi:hypothetical protein
MNWMEFNEYYERRQKPLESLMLSEADYINLFSTNMLVTYDNFVKYNRNHFESINNNFVLDFEPCSIYHDNSGRAMFWIEPKKPMSYVSKARRTMPFLLEAVLFEIKWSVKNKNILFEIYGWIHPYEWGGRNKLSYQDYGKNVAIGFDKIISERISIGDYKAISRLKYNFSEYFIKIISYYFLQ